MSGRDARSLLAEAGDGALKTVVELDFCLEPHQFARPRHIEEALWLAVGLRAVPHGLALVSDQPLDRLGKIADSSFLPCSEVDGLGGLEALRGEQQSSRGVIDVE